MYMSFGTCYVYQTYGMYYCFNISSVEPGAAVLLRALEPIIGMEQMRQFRKEKRATEITKPEILCNGPSKLCISMDIKKDNCNKLDLTENDMLWVEDDLINPDNLTVVKTARIGIESAGEEWAQKPLRYYIAGNSSVSKRDKRAEKHLETNVKSRFFQ